MQIFCSGATRDCTTNPGDITGQQLSCGIFWKNLHNFGCVFKGRYELFNADQYHMSRWQGGGQTGISLIGDERDTAMMQELRNKFSHVSVLLEEAGL